MSTRRLLVHQVRLEQRAFWRNPESAFFHFMLPLGLLLVLGALDAGDHGPGGDGRGVTLLVPGILAFGVIVTVYGNLAASIALLRTDGVLKRIRATPLPPAVYLTGQLASALATALLIATATIGLGWLVFGAAPRPDRLAVLAVTATLGIICFAALGLAVSAAIPSADAAGPITNGTYLPLALISGVFSGPQQLPAWLDHAASAFPIKALADSLRATYDPAAGQPLGALIVLCIWATLGIILARRYFKWQP